MDINVVFDRLFDYYQINSLVELANKLGVSQPALSQWKTRNAMSAVKKRCRELGIYNEIFGDLNSNIQINNNLSGGQIAQNVKGNLTTNNQNIDDIDNSTLSLFKEAYYKAKESDDIKGFRIHLMEYK